jgi:uncharacterized membrane protein
MADKPLKRRSRTARSVRWALGLSLALNLIFVGFIAGAAFRFRDGPPGAKMDPRGYAAAYVRALPRAERREIHRALREGASAGEERAGPLRRYEIILAALRAERFDAEAVQSVLKQQAARADEMQSRAQSVWLRQITAMSSAERLAYADRLEEILRRGPLKRRSASER